MLPRRRPASGEKCDSYHTLATGVCPKGRVSSRGMPPRLGRPRALTALVAAPLLVVTACAQGPASSDASSPPPSSSSTPGAVPAGLERFYDQELVFEPCDSYATTATEAAQYATSDAFECSRASSTRSSWSAPARASTRSPPPTSSTLSCRRPTLAAHSERTFDHGEAHLGGRRARSSGDPLRSTRSAPSRRPSQQRPTDLGAGHALDG